MSMDATEAPATEPAQDQPAVVGETGAPSPGEETSAPEQTGETAEFFSENFDPSTLDEPLQQRYKQMQADYTRKTQQLAQQRRELEQQYQLIEALQSDDPELQAQALEALGLEFADDPDPFDPGLEEEPDPIEEVMSEVEALKAEREAERARQQAEQHLRQISEHMERQFAEIQKRDGRQLSEKEKVAVSVLAGFVIDPDPETGLPDLNAAHEWLTGLRDEWQKGYVESKQAARPASSGQPGSPSFNFDDENERINRIAAVVQRRLGDD